MDIMRIISVKTGRDKPKRFYKTAKYLFRRIRLLSIMVFALLVAVSCEDFFLSEATSVNIPGGDSRLVVFSYLSPQDTVIRVRVSRSVPYYNPVKDEPFEGQAIVSLAVKGGEKSFLEYNEDYSCFVISPDEFKIEPGNIYQLSVELENGERVTAECYVPEMEYNKVEAEALYDEADVWGNKYTSVNWKITTSKNPEGSYYSTGAYVSSYRSYVYDDLTESSESIQELWLEKGNQYMFDESGRTWSFKATHWGIDYSYPPDYYDYPEELQNSRNIDSIFVYLMQTDENYYLFHRSYENYYYYGDDFPFAESVLIYSNVDGGLGIFAGYNRKNFYVPVLSR
jgi:hypothetical protein